MGEKVQVNPVAPISDLTIKSLEAKGITNNKNSGTSNAPTSTEITPTKNSMRQNQ